ncbi:LytTR family transcriptional regulator [Lactobacillus sp. DCY120]|uniref:LytTR family transcriptional regulator n=1 Tax=Bombilactobacillus apium TaxID=2675299 RepID=A0A850R7Q8_9LACO|nr:LytTR family DNA-binding domain-containing protein [Bombilactobacillus apium]NVY96565.1 LytTR family transcriptional regulator [Bombilactobacillus apium]
MKVEIEVNSVLKQTQVVIQTPQIDAQVQQIAQNLQELSVSREKLLFYQGDREYYLAVQEILFFETFARQVQAHTGEQAYQTRLHLYQLEELLPSTFMRVSKSTILNLQAIYSLEHTMGQTRITFQNTPKEVFVSRKYYQQVRQYLTGGESL